MNLEDIPTILAIEEVSFPTPWTAESFESELRDNQIARYYCLELDGNVVGYMGLWLIIGEAHITNVAIWPGCQGQGLGEYLMRSVMNELPAMGIRRITLEVKVSNTNAQKLYTKLGFTPAGIRRRYYSDNQEDAIIMWASL
ncbi:MAG: ribosomal protein S18-alanine N-acetyltransferase [Peptococcaceae bacterium]|nr:ribosomal protein S18-alanine N-acetyltransferase [Peptococcaceae bacterium]